MKKVLSLDSITVREAKIEDINKIVQLQQTKTEDLNYDTLDNIDLHLDVDLAKARIKARITDNDLVLLVAEYENEIVGTAYLNMDTGYLGGLYVKTQGRGVGSALINSRIQHAIKHGLPHLSMKVSHDNKRMLDLAKRYGFELFTSENLDTSLLFLIKHL
jgi:ribosomal protein S18 acetylase RimI-like enzyme